MRLARLAVAAGAAIATVLPTTAASAASGPELAAIRAAVAPYHSIDRAEADGWSLLPVCFDSAEGGMGLHWVQGIDLSLDPLHPEALVYTPSSSGGWKLGGVEYIVPVQAWLDAGNTMQQPPELLGETFHHNAALGLFVLHVWLFKHNPAGINADFNPTVAACP